MSALLIDFHACSIRCALSCFFVSVHAITFSFLALLAIARLNCDPVPKWVSHASNPPTAFPYFVPRPSCRSFTSRFQLIGRTFASDIVLGSAPFANQDCPDKMLGSKGGLISYCPKAGEC